MDPKSIYRSMRRVNVFLHFFRKNTGFCTRYYHELIAWVGYDRWQYVTPKLKTAWESAQNSFDKLYGISKSLRIYKAPDDIIDTKEEIKKEEKTPEDKLINAMELSADIYSKLSKHLTAIPKDYTPEGISCLNKLISLYSNDIDCRAKAVLGEYLDKIEKIKLDERTRPAKENKDEKNEETKIATINIRKGR